jgi:hypothetical protein
MRFTMKSIRCACWTTGALFTMVLSAAAQQPADTGKPATSLPHVNTISAGEKRAGWKLLFDGKTTIGWRNFKKQDISQGWQVHDGALCRIDNTAGDIVTMDEYDNFELQLDYKVPEHANSGILYRVSEDRGATWATGPEFQILDNTDPHGDSQRSAWCYGLYQSPMDPKTGKPVDATKPVGEWNHIRLVCSGPHIEHWMNGVKYCEYEIGSDDWNQRVAKSKFGKMPGFAKNTKGYLSLQGDHGNVCYANIKIRPISRK